MIINDAFGDLEQTPEQFEVDLVQRLPAWLRSQCCAPTEPWVGPDHHDHGHTDCYFLNLAADTIDALREQLARQAPIIDIAEAIVAQWEPRKPASDGSLQLLRAAVRALSVPAPPVSLQERCRGWHVERHPTDGPYKQLTKLAEEVGELARAHIGLDEGRPNRGDVAQEAAQVVLVLLSFIGRNYPEIDLMSSVEAEYGRLSELPDGCPDCTAAPIENGADG